MTAPGSERLRKAALALHALSRDDRSWLLRRLMPSMRMPLQSLLKQLQALGIAPGLRPGESLLPPVDEDPALDADEVALVDTADVRQIAEVLALQPEQLRVALLDMRPWRWRAGYWDSLSAFQRSRLAELSAAAPVLRAAMRAALLHGFSMALAPADKAARAGAGSKPAAATGMRG